MRLVVYTDNMVRGGADASMSHLLANLDASIDVAVMGVSREIVDWVATGRPQAARSVVPRPRHGHDARSLARHAQALRELRPDVVHVSLSSPWSCQYAIAAAALIRGARVVAVYQLPVPPVSRRQWRMKRVTTRVVDRHVGVGEQTSREIEALVGLPPGSVATIHNGVPDVAGEPIARPRAGPLIGAVGRLEPQKGFDLAVRALTEVDGATLVLVGEGSERTALDDLAHRLGVEDRVLFAGWVDTPRAYLGSFDVFVLPSRFEGFPLVALEALLARSAVVATDVGSVGEAVRNEETGLLVPSCDPTALAAGLRRLLGDADLRSRLGEQGRRLVLERFTAAHMARRFEALYADLA
jgi:glycosyltransferase involved in cell wall biosynthesis